MSGDYGAWRVRYLEDKAHAMRGCEIASEIESAFWDSGGTKAAAFQVVAVMLAEMEARISELERRLADAP
jgi:hypothetical protein